MEAVANLPNPEKSLSDNKKMSSTCPLAFFSFLSFLTLFIVQIVTQIWLLRGKSHVLMPK